MLAYRPAFLALLAACLIALQVTVNSWPQPQASDAHKRSEVHDKPSAPRVVKNNWVYPFQFLPEPLPFLGDHQDARYVIATAYLRSVLRKNGYFAVRIPFRKDNVSLDKAHELWESLRFGIPPNEEAADHTEDEANVEELTREINLVNGQSKQGISVYLIGCWKWRPVVVNETCQDALPPFDAVINEVLPKMKTATTAIHQIFFPTFRIQRDQPTLPCVNELGIDQAKAGSSYDWDSKEFPLDEQYTFNNPFHFALVNEETDKVILHEFVESVIPFTRDFSTSPPCIAV